MGLLVDRSGPRRLIFWGALLLGISFMLLSYTNALVTIGISGKGKGLKFLYYVFTQTGVRHLY